MKSIKKIAAIIVLTTVSFGSMAAEIGTVTATGSTLSGLEAQLAEKAATAGATSYKIIEASGNNQLHGTAVLYK